jgi:hypothetical protein
VRCTCCAELFLGAAKEGDTATVLSLAGTLGVPAGDAVDALGNTALHWAAGHGHAETVDEILKAGLLSGVGFGFGFGFGCVVMRWGCGFDWCLMCWVLILNGVVALIVCSHALGLWVSIVLVCLRW